MNPELYELYDDIELVRRIKIQQLRWLGHVIRMDDQAPAKKVFKNAPSGGSRTKGRSAMRWGDQVEENSKTLNNTNSSQDHRS